MEVVAGRRCKLPSKTEFTKEFEKGFSHLSASCPTQNYLSPTFVGLIIAWAVVGAAAFILLMFLSQPSTAGTAEYYRSLVTMRKKKVFKVLKGGLHAFTAAMALGSLTRLGLVVMTPSEQATWFVSVVVKPHQLLLW